MFTEGQERGHLIFLTDIKIFGATLQINKPQEVRRNYKLQE